MKYKLWQQIGAAISGKCNKQSYSNGECIILVCMFVGDF